MLQLLRPKQCKVTFERIIKKDCHLFGIVYNSDLSDPTIQPYPASSAVIPSQNSNSNPKVQRVDEEHFLESIAENMHKDIAATLKRGRAMLAAKKGQAHML